MKFRILGGTHKGRGFDAGLDSRTRPTSQKHREMVFAVLAGQLEGRPFLDAFSGSGAMGLEALSRGASRAVLVESDRRQAESIRRNADQLGWARQAVVLTGDVYRLGDRLAGPFGVIFIDPPYQAGFTAFDLAHSWLEQDGILVMEKSKREQTALDLNLFQVWKHKLSGDSEFYFLTKTTTAVAAPEGKIP